MSELVSRRSGLNMVGWRRGTRALRIRLWAGVLCVWCGHFTQVAATTIVVIRTPTEVVIAADSAATIQGDGLPTVTELACKIYQLDTNLFFAVSGLVNDRLTGLNIPKIVASDSHGGGSIAARLSRVESDVQTALLRELPQLKARDPAGYAKLIRSKGAVSVMFAGMDNGVPTARSFSVGLALSQEGVIEANILRESCPGNCRNGVRAFWFGEGRAIERLRTGGGMPELSMPELARHLVQIEIDARTPSVGGPVDVLRILPAGPVWVQRKQGCPAQP